jgi:hypothetical protein
MKARFLNFIKKRSRMMMGEAVAAEDQAVVAGDAEVVVEVVGDAEVVAVKNTVMKNLIFHSVSIGISVFWLIAEYHMCNPVLLKGPDFLKFYLILLSTFYFSVFLTGVFKESISKATIFFTALIFVLGVIKLVRGLMLGKPVGYLTMILTGEIIVILFVMSDNFKHKIK